MTGDFMIPAPRAGGAVIGSDISWRLSVGGNPLRPAAQRRPGRVQAGPVHAKLDGQLTTTTG